MIEPYMYPAGYEPPQMSGPLAAVYAVLCVVLVVLSWVIQ